MIRAKQLAISESIATGNKQQIFAAIDAALEGESGVHWIRDLNKLKAFVVDGAPKFSIIGAGNTKLGFEFLTWSSLPGGAHCPGAGDCVNWCYSFKSWRYPAAFARQCQNSILLQSAAGRTKVLDALDIATKATIDKNDYLNKVHRVDAPRVDFRLYVDGDFSSATEFGFWMAALNDRPSLNPYGYSKSFREILSYVENGGVVNNYILNISSGHNHAAKTLAKVEALPFTRGRFVAVDMPYNVPHSMHSDRDHQRKLRETYNNQTGRKAFTCGGKCFDCTPAGHACGSANFQGVDIIIGSH